MRPAGAGVALAPVSRAGSRTPPAGAMRRRCTVVARPRAKPLPLLARQIPTRHFLVVEASTRHNRLRNHLERRGCCHSSYEKLKMREYEVEGQQGTPSACKARSQHPNLQEATA